MRNNWLFHGDLDVESSYILPLAPLLSRSFGGHLFSHLSSFLDNSLHQPELLNVPGSMAFQDTFNCMSKLACTLLFWFTSSSTSNLSGQISRNHGTHRTHRTGNNKSLAKFKLVISARDNLASFCLNSGLVGESSSPVDFGKISSLMFKFLRREAARFQSLSVFSLATAFLPPLDNLSSKLIPIQGNGDIQMEGSVGHRPCEVGWQRCPGFSFSKLYWTRHAVEPKTGIEFPTILEHLLSADNKCRLMSEMLVGTGSRTMTIVKIKSLKVYAYGFYVHPYSICEKLARKYGSVPVDELNKSHLFYKDLLREDIGMTVRLIINCNGMKIKTVKNAFEKSLRARLLKTNPNTDYNCLEAFGSLFTKDIPLPAGTTVDFRRTTDGQLITESEFVSCVGGNQIGAVHSKDLCRAFFDMYIGDVPVSEQTKEEIGKNVARIISKC